MGDRANVVVQSRGKRVYLYTHWRGYDLPSILQDALKRGRSRWDDAPYLARIIFQDMVGNNQETTGFGISAELGDNEYSLLVCDTDSKLVKIETEGTGAVTKTYTMRQYVEELKAPVLWEHIAD